MLRQWQTFKDCVAQHNACAFACRRLPFRQRWIVFACAERVCEDAARRMLRSNPYRQRYLTCAECAECRWCRDCECHSAVPCIECGKLWSQWPYGVWEPGDCECPWNLVKVAGLRYA